jgi:alpha-L-fucosidase
MSMMNRRKFSGLTGAALLSTLILPDFSDLKKYGPWKFSHRLPKTDTHYKMTCGYVEDDPVAEYTWAPDEAYEDFLDMKFGIRLHWGLYSILQLQKESWPFLTMSLAERQAYQQMYKTWNPTGFNAQEWVDLFAESGAKMFSFTSKHHDGFSMFATKTRVHRRTNWLASGGPRIEHCDLAYSIMETPFRRDVIKELCDAAHQKNIKVDLYFSHPDWYDADFRPYNYHPLQVPSAGTLAVTGKDRRPETDHPEKRFGKSGLVIVPDPSAEEVSRMMKRHRAQLEELLTRYGKIKMVCLDQWLGPTVWPELRKTIMHLRKLRPDVMFRARGIGNYGDYYTPEGFVPGNKANSDTPWFVIYPLGGSFSYDPDASHYKGARWIVKNLIDSAAKGGNFMAGIGPDGNGRFHPKAIEQLRETGEWLRVNGKGIYATRAREGELWKEGDHIRFTRTKDNKTVYAFSLERPAEQLVLDTVRPRPGSTIRLLGANIPLQWDYDNRLTIHIPSATLNALPAAGQLAYGFSIDV